MLQKLEKEIKEKVIEASRTLPPDVAAAINAAYEREE